MTIVINHHSCHCLFIAVVKEKMDSYHFTLFSASLVFGVRKHCARSYATVDELNNSVMEQLGKDLVWNHL